MPNLAVAAQKKKKIIQELKHPDQFVDFWTHTWNRISGVAGPRKKPLLAAGCAFALFVVGAAVFDKLDEDHRVSASEALEHIQHMAAADLQVPDEGKDAVDKLLKGNTVDAADKKDDDVPRFKTAAERDTAVLGALDKFLADHGGTSLKSEALVMKGATLVDAARYDDAIKTFETALGGKLDDRLRFLAHEGLGYAYEGKGDFDKALGAFGALTDDAKSFHDFYRDRALYQKARITERKGDRAGAVKLYKEVLAQAADTPLHDQISDRLAVLEAK